MSTVHEETRVPPHVGATQNKDRASKSFESAAVSAIGNQNAKSSAIRFFDILAATLLVLGGLNWGLIGLFQVDLVATVFEESQRMIYTLVGASAVYAVLQVVSLTAVKRRWRAVTSRAAPKVTT